MLTDIDAYKKFKGLHHWFNKLWLSEALGYKCGPAGVAPEESGMYIVRPVMNLAGMSIGAEKKWIEQGDNKAVKPGYFWCEWFDGRQVSIDYEWCDEWHPVSGWEASVDESNLYKFKKWVKIQDYPRINSFYNEIAEHGVRRINIEFVNNNPIEVHLRPSPDPNYDELIPIWVGEEKKVELFEKLGYTYINSYDDGEGHLTIPRVGFMVKNKE